MQKGNRDIMRLKEPREVDAYQASKISIQKDSNNAKDDTTNIPSSISTSSPTHDDTLPTMWSSLPTDVEINVLLLQISLKA